MHRRSIVAAVQPDSPARLHGGPTPTDIDIDVDGGMHDGVAALSGQVNGLLAQWAAERAARRESAVREPGEIGAASSGSIRLGDADIARTAQAMLQSITLLPAGCIEVDVDGGWITLSGSVQWGYQRQAAAAAVRHVIGVTGITDRVTVVETAPVPANRSPLGRFFGLG